jgi:Bacterial protein of unknown function (DUF885)
MSAQQNAAPAFAAWLEDFFASYYRRRPVNATFIGCHEYDHLLPDLSLDGAAQTREEMGDLLGRLRTLPPEPLTEAQRLDLQLAEGFLEIGLWEYDSAHFLHSNPSVFTGEAIFGLLSLFLRPFAPFEQRAESAISRLEGIPSLLAQGRSVLRDAPIEWTERAFRECAGALALCGRGIDILTAEHGYENPLLRSAADHALRGFVQFREWLGTELSGRTSSVYSCGSEVFDLLLKRGHFLTESAGEIERYAETVVDETNAYLHEHAADFGAESPREVLARLADLHPAPDRYYARYAELWEGSRDAAFEHNLLTWPDYPIEYRPQPLWAREAAPFLYFLFYRSPAPFDELLPVDYLVTPIEPGMTSEEQHQRLRATNESVMKLNHIIHHGGIGHHIQNWHALRAASRIGQIAAVDCASRIALFCGGTMAEGWACYAPGLMDEVGFLTPLESYSEKHARLRMAARALCDVRLHDGRWTLDDAASFYRERVGMPADAARVEAVKNSMFPATALMYLTGTDLIHQLRKTTSRRDGTSFDLRAFHDRFLSYGSMPVALVAAAMH